MPVHHLLRGMISPTKAAGYCRNQAPKLADQRDTILESQKKAELQGRKRGRSTKIDFFFSAFYAPSKPLRTATDGPTRQ
jgi:hypothetical protein